MYIEVDVLETRPMGGNRGSGKAFRCKVGSEFHTTHRSHGNRTINRAGEFCNDFDIAGATYRQTRLSSPDLAARAAARVATKSSRGLPIDGCPPQTVFAA